MSRRVPITRSLAAAACPHASLAQPVRLLLGPSATQTALACAEVLRRVSYRCRLAALVLSVVPLAGHTSDLTVMEAVFTHSVTDRQYGKQVAPNSVARPIYFWTKLQGGPKAYSDLKSQGKLPIKHYWTSLSVFEAASGQEIDPTQEADDRTLPAGRVTAFSGMESLVQNGKPFTWRTWTYKRAIWRGTWVVRVLYADGQPVMCGAKACKFTIALGD